MEQNDARSDDELVAAVNAGDAEAFAALYRRHRDWVHRLAFRFTGDHELALDVLQETFLYFLKKFPGFRLTARLQTFLYPVVRNRSIDLQKASRRFEPESDGLEELSAPREPDGLESERAQLSEALRSLTEDHRETLLLRFVEGFSLAEIAAATGVPLGTVKSRLHHALSQLRHDPHCRGYFGKGEIV